MRQLRIQSKARRDLIEIHRNLTDTLGDSKADQFEAHTSQTFLDLAQMPNIGAPRKMGRDQNRELRMWRVRGFEEYLIFYYVEPEFVRIGRVVHAKRDYRRREV